MIVAASDGHAEGASSFAVGNESPGGDTRKRNRAAKLRRLKLISLAVASCFSAELAFADAAGPTVVNGTATFQQSSSSVVLSPA
jgi:hypothetical protein